MEETTTSNEAAYDLGSMSLGSQIASEIRSQLENAEPAEGEEQAINLEDVPESLRDVAEAESETKTKDSKAEAKPVDPSELLEKIGLSSEELEAIAPLLKNDAEASDVIKALASPETISDLVWQAVDSPEVQQTLLSDPDVQQTIAEALDMPSINEVVQAIEFYKAHAEDYNPTQSQVIAEQRATRQQEYQSQAANYGRDFFEDSYAEVLNEKQLSDPTADIGKIAQQKFLEQNGAEYFKVQQGVLNNIPGSRVRAARLQNKWEAIMRLTVDQYSPVMQKQPAKQATKPTASPAKSKVKAQPRSYDYDSHTFASEFSRDFMEDLRAGKNK